LINEYRYIRIYIHIHAARECRRLRICSTDIFRSPNIACPNGFLNRRPTAKEIKINSTMFAPHTRVGHVPDINSRPVAINFP